MVYDHARQAQRAARSASGWLQHDILLAGRYSEWEYYNSDHAFIAGKHAAETVAEREAERMLTTDYFDSMDAEIAV